ncbi:MAG: M20/M25/M40 family metallo-hydrolase [Gemmatimonadaceae bacterium]
MSVVAPENPTESELTTYLNMMAPKVKGGIVMVGVPPLVPVNFNERPKRTPDDQAKARYQPQDPAAAGGGRGGRGAGPGGFGGGRGNTTPPTVTEGHLTAQQVNARITALIRDNMPALRLMAQGGGRIPGVIVAQNGAGQIYDDTTPQPPAVILRNDDYGRIFRIIQDGTPVNVEFNVQNTFYPEGKTSYVIVADIPGTDKSDEVVMMGGHLDSWTSATGATDNAIGCAIMMEAARIMMATGAKPRRTVRVALWSGEEEGLLGSFAYVKQHFGSAEEPTKDFNKLVAYWNIDDGTGRVRGASIFGPPESALILAQYLKPFEDFGIYGATASTARVEGGSDNGAFAVAGLPGIGTQQDNIEYNSTTWHTNLDNYERIVPEDVIHNAIVSASLMLHLANRDENLPRFAPDKMPAVPAGRGAGGGRGGAVSAITAVSHVYAVSAGKPLTVAAPGLVGASRLDDAAPLVAVIGTKTTHGKITLNANGGFVFTPNAGYTGTDSFTYKLSRGSESSADATVTFVVNK